MLTVFDLITSLDNPTPATDSAYTGLDGPLSTADIAIDNGTVVIGDQRDDTAGVDSGSVYIYDGLVASPLVLNALSDTSEVSPANDGLGSAVALVNRTVYMSAVFDEVGGFANAGSVRSYDLDTATWNEIEHPDPTSIPIGVPALFGLEMDASEDVLVVFASATDGDLDNDGTLDVAGGNASSRYSAIYAIDPITHDVINSRITPLQTNGAGVGEGMVAVDGDWVILGGTKLADPGNSSVSGGAYLWNWRTDTLSALIPNPSPDQDDFFGSAVDILGDRVVISAPGEDTGGLNNGIVYLMDFDVATGSITNTTTLTPQSSIRADFFGQSLALTETQLLVGSAGTLGIQDVFGTVYAFDDEGVFIERRGPETGVSNSAGYGRHVVADRATSTFVIGAPEAAVGGVAGSGRAFVYGDTTTIRVNSLVDEPDADLSDGVAADAAGRITLRAAIQHANENDTEAFRIILPEGQYTLDETGVEQGNAEYNDLDVTGDITIVGDGAGLSVIDAGGATGLNDRLFHVLSGGSLELSGLTLTGGAATTASGSGGAVWSDGGTLTLNEVALVGNTATTSGGAIYSLNSTTTIRDSVLEGNDAPAGAGGAIRSLGASDTVSVSGTVFANHSSLGSPGDPIRATGGSIVTSLGNNLSDILDDDLDTTLGDRVGSPDYVVTRVGDQNAPGDDTYALSLREAVIAANGDPSATVWLPAWDHRLTISGNDSVAAVGDLDVTGDVEIIGVGAGLSVIDAGGAGGLDDRIFDVQGGALDLSHLTLTGGNALTADGSISGGAINAFNATLNLSQVAIVNNRTDVSGGGVNTASSVVTIVDSVFADNDATGGIGGAIRSQSDTVTIQSSVFARNDSISGTEDRDIRATGAGSVTSLGNNLADFDGSGSPFTDGVNGDVVTTTAPDYVVTSVADRVEPNDDTYALSLREAVDAVDDTNNSVVETIFVPGWTFVVNDVLEVARKTRVQGVGSGLTQVKSLAARDVAFAIKGDFNGDGKVDLLDLNLVNTRYGDVIDETSTDPQDEVWIDYFSWRTGSPTNTIGLNETNDNGQFFGFGGADGTGIHDLTVL